MRAETLADRDDFLTARLVPVACRSCDTTVLAKKNSPAHTSIQWTTDAATSCPVFAARVAEGAHPALLDSCEKLGESIDEAAREGTFAHD
ncbi:hypothetical protein [Prauserella cavernicola]|uniref:Ferredoxin n=1 Tax=Prauserella cavernicola TaxID=2800127 RepID=A0A934QY70_9PSEU|nr:hypothetical protein [Prauserella cavernicola]MBK1788686.1 hypothetical protein [Prauserella cavernicola]